MVGGQSVKSMINDNDDLILSNSCIEIEALEKYGDFFNFTGDDGYISNKNIKMFHTNIRSFSKNFDDLLIYLSVVINYLDVIVLTECWLEEGEEGVSIEGFDLVLTDNRRNKNDGVIVYTNKRLSATASQITLGDVYGISLDFIYCNKNFNILALYRTFDSNIINFIDALETYYNNIARNINCILLGDINIDLLSHDRVTATYLNSLIGHGLVQCVDKPTRVTDHSVTCLDHIFVRYDDMNCVQAAVLQTTVTDHYSIGLKITVNTPDIQTRLAPITYIDKALLSDGLANSPWECVLNSMDTNECSVGFLNIITNSLSIARKQIINPTTRKKKLKPWISIDLLNLIRERDRLSKISKNQPFNREIKNNYNNLRHHLSNSLKYAKRVYYRTKINESRVNSKLFWQIINELSGRKKRQDSFQVHKFLPGLKIINEDIYKQVANDFNVFFSEVGKGLADNIAGGGELVLRDCDYRSDTDFTMHTVTVLDVIRTVNGLRGGSAPGMDGFSATLLKMNLDIIAQPLTHLINLSLTTGVFPNNLKLAKIVPLFKSNNFTDKNNFRPIALLSIFSKVLERIVKEQLVSYLYNNNILSDCQYGFRKDKGIDDALFDIAKELNYNISRNYRCMLVFWDLMKAFDSLDCNILLRKLELIGVRGAALSWFRGYFSEREQVVSICGRTGEPRPIEYGVIQGSTLGPILFLIYINNISKIRLGGRLFLFADDSLLFLSGRTWDEVRTKGMNDLMILKKWFDQNVLSLNIAKTKFLPISLNITSEYQLNDLKIHNCGDAGNLNCNCGSIERVYSYKYLGVMFDHRLKWNHHIAYVQSKIRKYIYAFRRLGDVLEERDIKTAYFAYVQSLLSFGNMAWGGAACSVLEPLFVTQKSILKAGLKKNKRYPTDRLFHEVSLLSLRQLYIKNLLVYIYKHHCDIFSDTSHSYNTRHADNIGIHMLQLVKSFSKTNSFYISHILFRNINNHFKHLRLFDSNSVSIFKHKVDNLLLEIGLRRAETLILSEYMRA